MFNLSKLGSDGPLLPTAEEASYSYLLIDAMLALTALVVGFFSALFYFRHTSAKDATQENEADELAADAAYAVDRANMAAQQLGDLAQGMASDISLHSAVMGDISDQLQSDAGVDSKEKVDAAIHKIMEANSILQQRLVEAEKKIQAQAEEIRSQQSEARTDSLTGLSNRRAFDASLSEHLEKFKQKSAPVSLMMLDVDHFKKFNDDHGHQAGDEVLRSVGSTLKNVLKQNDLPCRYGGEEFAVVMPNTTANNGRIAAGRVRKAIELMNVEFENKNLSVTASVGVAEAIAGDDEVQIIRRADEAVYASKEAGRNCGHWHDGEACLPLATAKQEAVEESALPAGSNVVARLPDKTMFLSELQRRVSESHRFGVPLAAMFLRVKEHDRLVETYGEAVGDLVLDSVVTFIQSALREMDLLGAYNLGEFVVMLPGSSESEAIQVGRRLRTAISQCELPLGDSQLKLDVSHGVADVQPDDDAERMIERAIDAAKAFEEAEVEPAAV